MMKVHNLPPYYKDYEYVIVRTIKGEDYYYGSDNDLTSADRYADQWENTHIINSVRVVRAQD